MLFSILIVIALVLVSCAPLKKVEEGALAGQAYGGAGGSSFTVKACTDTGTSVTYTKFNGRTETKNDECAAGNKRKDYSCNTVTSGKGRFKQTKTYFNTHISLCGAGTACQNGVCVVLCGNGVVDAGENCGSCAADVSCASGEVCQDEACIISCTPSEEICDGIDNDCDQLTDENFNFLTDKNHCGECQIACDIGMFCVSGSCAPCTQEGYSTTVTLTGTQKISEVKPELTAADLPLLLRDGQVTNEKGTVSYMQRLLFSNPASGFVDYTENDMDVTAYFLRMPYNIPSKEMVRYVLQFQQPFESDIIGGLRGQILEDYVGTSIEILGNTYTITNAVRDSSTGISLILVNGGTTIILPDENIFYIPPFFRYILNGEPIDGTAGSIEGYIFDNENRLTIDAIVMTMNAEDDYFVGAGSTLSKEIEDAGEDPEVLFTQNWDIRFKEYNTATNSRTIEIGRLCPIDPPICIDYDDGVENEALVASGAFGLNPQTNQVEFLSDYCIALTSSGGVYSAFERQCSPDGSIYGEVIPCPGEIPCGCG